MAEKKKSAYERVQDNRKELVDKIIENMEKGYIWEAGWNINALRSQNISSGTKYNGINRLSLGYVVTDNNYQDPRFITFKQAQDKGWKVKKGEHGYPCEYWIWTRKEEQINEKGEKEKVDVPLEKPKISYFTVFNMEQIEGNYPKFELPNKLSNESMLELANDLIASSRCPVQESAQDRAFYSLFTDSINLPLRNSFSSEEDFLATLLHEMAHSTGNELGRTFGTDMTDPLYAKEELVAELSSLFIKAELGISNEGKHFENHSAYLKSWNSMLKSDYNELYRASKEAEKACDFIMDRYREYLKTKENVVEKSEIEIPKEATKEATNDLVNENDSLKGLKLTFHFSEHDFNIPEEKTLVGKEAYDLLQKIINFDKEQNKVQEIINKEMEEGKFNTEGLMYYKTCISLSHNDTPILENTRIDLGDLEFGKEKEVSKALEDYLTSIPKNRIENPIEYVKFCEEYFNKKITPKEVIDENKEKLKNINGLIFDLKKYEIEKDISEMKNINKFNENGNKQGIWFEVGENSILECKYNNGLKSGKFTETYLMANENEPIRTQGMYRNDKLSGEIASVFSNDDIASIKNYKAGVLLAEESYYINGNLKNISSYDKDKCVEFKNFYENGNMKESLEFINKDEKIYKTYDSKENVEQSLILYASKEKALSMIENNIENYSKVDFNLKGDKEIALAVVKKDSNYFNNIPTELKNNKEFVMESVKIDGNILKNAIPEFKSDKDVVLTAINQNGNAFKFVSENLKHNDTVISKLIEKDGANLKLVPFVLKNNRDIVCNAVKSNGMALEFASSKLQDDKDIVLEAVKQNKESFIFAGDKLKEQFPTVEKLLTSEKEIPENPWEKTTSSEKANNPWETKINAGKSDDLER